MLYTLLLLVMLRLIIKIECRPSRFLCDLIDSFPRTECVTTTHVRLVYSFKKKKKSRLYRDIARSNWSLEIYLCVSIYFAMMQKNPAQKLIPSPIYIDLFHLSLTVRINKRAPIFCIFLLLFCRFDVCLFVCFLLSVWDLSIKEFSI